MTALHAGRVAMLAVVALLVASAAGCAREEGAARDDAGPVAEDAQGEGTVTISGDDRIAQALTWRAPKVVLGAQDLPAARKRADTALEDGRLYADAESAIPLYLAVLAQAPDDADARAGLRRALRRLIAEGDAALSLAGDDIAALRKAGKIAAVARSAGAGTSNADVLAYLSRVDRADRLWELNRLAERDLRAGRYGEDADQGEDAAGALPKFRQALAIEPGQPRAMQGLAAVESGLIRRAEQSAQSGDFEQAQRWLLRAAKVRSGSGTIADARARIDDFRNARIARLRDEGLAALASPTYNALRTARRRLAEILAIARPGDAAATELRERIDLATYYGQFRPGQVFTDALENSGRGPQMVVVPHGGFRMGAKDDEPDATDAERPQRYVRFDRGFAMSRTEVTVGQFRQFIIASGYRARAARRGHSLAYDERGGNFVRRGGIDWRHDYAGQPAKDDMPVLHVSARDAEAYAKWLSRQSGQRYRLPSEAEFEYALRAGGATRFPWGEGAPSAGIGNLTGSGDRSPGGRDWGNAFPGYRDGYWGPAPVARFKANPFGLYDLAGNVSEWVADCWHDGYRRAPVSGVAWLNPGCRTRVVRGGSWASSPAQTRSSWRMSSETDTTNARIGFRVVRDL